MNDLGDPTVMINCENINYNTDKDSSPVTSLSLSSSFLPIFLLKCPFLNLLDEYPSDC